MDKATITRSELMLLLSAVTDAHWKLEADGKTGSAAHRQLRALEDRLGSLQGEVFTVSAIR